MIAALQDEGVFVAQGAGTAVQKVIVVLAAASSLVAFLAAEQLLVYLLVLPAVLVAIDFMSGFVHWFFDTQVEPSRTFLGRIAVDFLDHHVRPRRTVEVGFFVSAWRPALLATLPLVTLSVLLPLPAWGSALLFWIGGLSMYVPQTHKWAHVSPVNSFIAHLQLSRLVLNPQAHGVHHQDNAQSFCVFTGWLNPLLDRTRFWRGLEKVFLQVRKVF